VEQILFHVMGQQFYYIKFSLPPSSLSLSLSFCLSPHERWNIYFEYEDCTLCLKIHRKVAVVVTLEQKIIKIWKSYTFRIITELRTLKLLYWPGNSVSPRDTIALIVIAAAVVSLTVHGSLPITAHEYPLMPYTKLISEKHFTAGRSLVIVLPLAEEDSANRQVECLTGRSNLCLTENLHTSGRWPVLVYNTSCTCYAIKSLQEL